MWYAGNDEICLHVTVLLGSLDRFETSKNSVESKLEATQKGST